MKRNEMTEEMVHKTLNSLLSVKIEQHRLEYDPALTTWDLVIEYPHIQEDATGNVNVSKKMETVCMFSLRIPLENKEFLYVPEFLKRQMEAWEEFQNRRVHLA